MNDDDAIVEPQDLAIDELCELLHEAGAEVTESQAEALRVLVAEAGGIDEALAALSLLARTAR
jgi:hypothetical protein